MAVTTSSLPQSYSTVTGNTISASWGNSNSNFTSSNHIPVMTIPHGTEKVILEKSATLEVKGNVVINGIDLEERLKAIEKLLLIPERDVILETKHPKLKEKFNQYITLPERNYVLDSNTHAELRKKYDDYITTLEKYRTFERIKGND